MVQDMNNRSIKFSLLLFKFMYVYAKVYSNFGNSKEEKKIKIMIAVKKYKT